MDFKNAVRKVMDVHEIHNFAQLLCTALNDFAYVVVGAADEDQNVVAFSGWAGEVPEDVDSRAPHIAYGKLGELILAGSGIDEELILTPIEGNEKSFGWMGGTAQNLLAVAVSKWAEEHDRLLALLTLYHHLHQPLRLHHVGFRYATKGIYDEVAKLSGNVLERNIPGDHDRIYLPVAGIDEDYYREHQWFPNGPNDSARHWDFVVEDPKHFLRFIAHAFDQEPEIFDDAGESDPIGMVWVTSSKSIKLGVMARSKWWDVEEG